MAILRQSQATGGGVIAMKNKERYLQLCLTTVLVVMLLMNLIPAQKVYQTSQAIKTDTFGGSSLAERYLMLGDWPEAENYLQPIEQHSRFIINYSGLKR